MEKPLPEGCASKFFSMDGGMRGRHAKLHGILVANGFQKPLADQVADGAKELVIADPAEFVRNVIIKNDALVGIADGIQDSLADFIHGTNLRF